MFQSKDRTKGFIEIFNLLGSLTFFFNILKFFYIQIFTSSKIKILNNCIHMEVQDNKYILVEKQVMKLGGCEVFRKNKHD